MTDIRRLSHMSESETIEYLAESLKKGADIARQLGRIQGKQKWLQLAQMLDRVYQKSMMLATARSLSRTDTLVMLDVERRKLGELPENKRAMN